MVRLLVPYINIKNNIIILSNNPNIIGNFGENIVILKTYKIYHKYIQYENTKSNLNAAIYIYYSHNKTQQSNKQLKKLLQQNGKNVFVVDEE